MVHCCQRCCCNMQADHVVNLCYSPLWSCRHAGAPDLLAQFVPFDDAAVKKAEAWKDARLQQQAWEPSVDGFPEPPNNCWLLRLTAQAVADADQHLPNLVAVLNCLLVGAQAQIAGNERFCLQPSRLCLRYAQACGTIDVLRQNRVVR